MSRPALLFFQLLVAVVALGLWQLFATVPIFGRMWLPPFFFSNPVDVGSQIVDWFVQRRDLEASRDHAVGVGAGVSRSARSAGSWSASGSRASRASRRSSIPM